MWLFCCILVSQNPKEPQPLAHRPCLQGQCVIPLRQEDKKKSEPISDLENWVRIIRIWCGRWDQIRTRSVCFCDLSFDEFYMLLIGKIAGKPASPILWANTTNWNLSPYSTLELYSLINNWFIISKSFLSINFHAFRYFQATIRKPLPKFKCHYRRELACTASFPDSILFMVDRRRKFFG